MVWDFIQSLVWVAVLVVSSGIATHLLERLSTRIKRNKLFLAAILMGFALSLPELAVGIASSLRGQSEIALGDIMGANLANLSWIVGGAAMMMGTISVVGDFWNQDLWITVGLAALPFLMMIDGGLSRLEGLFLLVFYLIYVRWTLKSKNLNLKQAKLVGRRSGTREIKLNQTGWKYLFGLGIAIILLALSASRIIDLSVSISQSLGVSPFGVGLLVISFVTTLPELVLSLWFSEKQKVTLLLADILGSVVVNSTLILGLVAVVSPVSYSETIQKGVAGIFLVMILVLFWIFTESKRKLERWEGIVLVGLYAMFVGLQCLLI